MRLIDADALKDELLKCAYPSEREWYFAEVAQIIDEQPTMAYLCGRKYDSEANPSEEKKE